MFCAVAEKVLVRRGTAMTWQTVMFWVFAGGLAGGVAVGMLNWMVRRVRGMSAKRIAESIPDATAILMQDSGANFFGLESLGGMQLRGNGGLVLTSGCLHFFMLFPRREMKISLEEIEETSLVRSHCGKSVFRDLLKVKYRAERGGVRGLESAAWYVGDAAGWKRAIDAARGGAGH